MRKAFKPVLLIVKIKICFLFGGFYIGLGLVIHIKGKGYRVKCVIFI